MSMPSAEARRVWLREAALMSFWLGLAAIVGLWIGYVTLCLLIAVSVYLVIYLVYAYQLHRWLTSDRVEPSEGMGVWQEIYTELYRLKQRNRRRKKRLKNIVNEFKSSTAALPFGAVVLDSLGRILWFNSAAGALLGLRAPLDRGQRVVNLLRYPRFSEFLARNRGNNGELEMPSPTNEDTTILVQLVPYGDHQRLLIARDISEQRRLEATRRDFVANASHELRTPLTVLRGYLEMMEEEAGEDTQLVSWRTPIHEMGAQARRMGQIIESLLKLARVESDGLQLKQEYIDVPQMIESLVEDIRRAAGVTHRFVLDIDPGLALFGRASEIESVFSNLLGNAVRYTPADGQITVRWWQDDAGAHFAVSDTGPGIDAEHMPRLTERFYRVDRGRKSTAGGTGLGLAIVKHCLEHHEAVLAVDSVPGQGSTFSCRFPSQRILGRRAA